MLQTSSLLKLYSSDVGLLTSQYGNTFRSKILFDSHNLNLGGVYENFVAQELNAHGYPSYFYCKHGTGELDFIIEQGEAVLPIEVKSGKDYYVHSALSKTVLNPEYDIPEGFVFADCNVSEKGKVKYFPVYMCAFISDEVSFPMLSLPF